MKEFCMYIDDGEGTRFDIRQVSYQLLTNINSPHENFHTYA